MPSALDAAAKYPKMGASGGWTPGRAGKLHSSHNRGDETAWDSLFSLADLVQSDRDDCGDSPPPRRVRITAAETRAKTAVRQALVELMKTPPLHIRNLRAQEHLVAVVVNAIEATRLLKLERRANQQVTHDAVTAEAALREALLKIQNKHRVGTRNASKTALHVDLACQEANRHERPHRSDACGQQVRRVSARNPSIRPGAWKPKVPPRLRGGVWVDVTADDLAAAPSPTSTPTWTYGSTWSSN